MNNNPSIAVLNLYYPASGNFDEVVRTRRQATVVRRALGLSAGEILRRGSGSAALSSIIWECDFEDSDAHDQDMGERAASPDFEAVRARMGTLLDRFERTEWSVVHTDPDGFHRFAAGSVRVFNAYFPLEGNLEAVVAQRIRACNVRQEHGFSAGRVLRRLSPTTDSAADLPHVLWQLDYPSLADRASDVQALEAVEPFRAVRETMRQLLRRFQRGAWQLD
jgi:hypothetical protein